MGHRIISGSVDKTIRIWDADGGIPITHTDSIVGIDYSRDGHIVSGSENGELRQWDAGTGMPFGPGLYTSRTR